LHASSGSDTGSLRNGDAAAAGSVELEAMTELLTPGVGALLLARVAPPPPAGVDLSVDESAPPQAANTTAAMAATPRIQ